MKQTARTKTCRDVGHGVFRCSRCRAFVDRGAVSTKYGIVPLRYCPNCGARIERKG